MKKYLLMLFFIVIVSSFARADDASESMAMEAALAEQFGASAAEPAPEALEMPVEPELVVDEPVKARDVLPEEDRPLVVDEITGDTIGGETLVDEEGNLVSAKSLLLEDAADTGVLMLADFDEGDKPNNLGGDFGGWDKDPSDDTQGCRATFASDDSTGNIEGFALRLDYDVDSPSPAYNGFWMKLENVSAVPYDTLSFDIRGASHRFTKILKVELKTPDSRSSSFFINGITNEWQTIQIPLKRFKGIKNWANMSEMILVFDDVNTSPKKGTLLVDQIRFERLENGMPQEKEEGEDNGYYLSDDKGSEELITQPS